MKKLIKRFLSKNKEIDLTNTNEEELSELINSFDLSDQQEFDYTSQCWGHALQSNDLVNDDPYVFKIMGFNSSGKIIGSRRIRVGDFILQKMESGKIGKSIVLRVDFFKDPDDMFKAFITCIGYKK